MSSEPLGVYLNDHLAGSVGALELLDHLISERGDAPADAALAALKADIAVDQGILRGIIARLGLEEHGARKALAWLGEKVARLKLGATGSDEKLPFLEALEALTLGIQGKAAMCRSLIALCAVDSRLREPELVNLAERALDQFARADTLRIAAAVEAFAAR